MTRGYLSESKKRKEMLVKYIGKLMVEKGMNQTELARCCGKSQPWLSKKLEHCGFYTGELIEILKVLGAEPEDIGRILVGKI